VEPDKHNPQRFYLKGKYTTIDFLPKMSRNTLI